MAKRFGRFDIKTCEADPFQVAAQQNVYVHTSHPIRIVGIALRLSLAAGFVSAVADRFGWWAPFGQGSWGSMSAFAEYTHRLVPFASGWFLAVIAWGAASDRSQSGSPALGLGGGQNWSARRLAWYS